MAGGRRRALVLRQHVQEGPERAVTTIVILDDQATNRSIYARLAAVVEPGAVVEVFADPLDALEWLEHNRADLVVTDYKMPSMDGADFTRRLRVLPRGREVPILVITVHDDRGYRVRALDAGATDFLQSPVDHFELVTRARNLLALGRRTEAAAAAGMPGRADGPGSAAAGRATEPPGEAPPPLGPILDAVSAMVNVVDREGRCTFANAACAAALGAAPKDLLGTGLAERRGAEASARHRRDDLLVFDTGVPLPSREEVLEDGTGARRHVATVKTPLRGPDGTVTAVVTTSFELPARLAETDSRRPPPPGRAA
jgi:PAS domain S-box-containing protein